MECNKDEATRAKEIAEKKFEAKDYFGSQKFALKAQSLYPGLDGIKQMLTTLNVYISSETRVNGESDWYKVLDVNPLADDETLKKQYRKLALVLHPDKNKSIGADGAFKLISEAWNLLSDKFQRSLYDQKRNIKPTEPKTRASSSDNKTKTSTKTGVQKAKADKKKAETSNGNKQKYPITPTFWTVCHRCRLKHEYLRMYLHRNLLCPGCNMAYFAFEYSPPKSRIPINWNDFLKKTPDIGSARPCSEWDPFAKMGNGPFGEAFEKSKKEREDALEAMRREREATYERETGSASDSNAGKRRSVDDDLKGTKTSSLGDLPNFEIPKTLVDEKEKAKKMKKLEECEPKTTVGVTENGKLNYSKKGNCKNGERFSIPLPDSDNGSVE